MKAERKADKEEMMARMDNNKEEMKNAINSIRSELEGKIMGQMELQTNRPRPFVRSLTRRLRKHSDVYRHPLTQLPGASKAI
jgi:hypothetical protein